MWRLFYWAVVVCCVSGTSGQQWQWVQRLDGDASAATAIFCDRDTNVYVGGTFTGTNFIGTNRFVSAGGSDVFLAKLNATGAVLWAIGFGGPEEDSLATPHLPVTTNGAVYLCGRFSIPGVLVGDTNDSISNVFLARVDDARLTWYRSGNAGFTAGGAALGADESLWIFGSTNRAFLRQYGSNGTVINGFPMGNTAFTPGRLIIGPDKRFAISGRFWGNVDLGTTNIQTGDLGEFAAVINSSGSVDWAWYAGHYWYANPVSVYDIAFTPDGGLITVSSFDTTLPQQYSVVVKLAADGEAIWRVERTFGFKSFHSARSVVTDASGTIHISGDAEDRFYYGYYRRVGLTMTLKPSGEILNEQLMLSPFRGDANTFKTLAVDHEGGMLIAGSIMGSPRFGSNVMAAGPSGVPRAFVARRLTLSPRLRIYRHEANLKLSWPYTSLPFALRQTEGLTNTAWTNVMDVPQEAEGLRQMFLSPARSHVYYRLRQTNEVGNGHAPEFWPGIEVVPYPRSYLDEASLFINRTGLVSGLVFRAWARDDWGRYDGAIGGTWFNPTTGELLTNGTTAKIVWVYVGSENYPWTYFELADQQLTFTSGTHSIRLVASVGGLSATNSVTFSVVSVPGAIDRLIASVAAMASAPEQMRILPPLGEAREAALNWDWPTARQSMETFQALIATSSDLTSEEIATLSAASTQVITAIGGG